MEKDREAFEAWWRDFDLGDGVRTARDLAVAHIVWQAALAYAREEREGWRLVPMEPVCGPEYHAGNWSRRQWEAALRDQPIAPQSGHLADAGKMIGPQPGVSWFTDDVRRAS